MNFDIFNEIKFVHKDLLLKTSKTAERSIMVSPYNALANEIQEVPDTIKFL